MTYHKDFTLPESLMEAIASEGLDGLPELIRVVINTAMQAERQQYLKTEPYQRTPEREGHANGYKPKTVRTRVGEITFSVPQVREGGFYPQALEKGLRSERALTLALAEMYVQGGSPYANAYSASLGANETIEWNLGYTAGTAWMQTAGGGDVYAATTVSSAVPAGASPRYFSLTSGGGSGGVVTYGTSYDFDSSVSSQGAGYASSYGWLANETYPATDYYAVMYHRFGSPDPEFTGNTTFTTKPASGTHSVDGNLTIDTNPWVVGNGESVVVLVDGNLTINERITIAGSGFVAFVVNGDIRS